MPKRLCYPGFVKLIAPVKLQTTREQLATLKQTMQEANRACDYISSVAWEQKTFNPYALHKLVYQDVRKQFGLSAQVVVRCLSKVADSFKLDKKRKRKFKPHGAITYDDRILSWQLEQSQVSIWTTHGRIQVPFVCGNKQPELIKTRQGETDLILFRDRCDLLATCDVAEPEPIQSESVLGVDLGVVNIAVDSDGTMYSGKTINTVRFRHRRLRTKLQKKGTRSAKRLLKKLSGKEARFAKNVNHTISTHVVKLAQGTRRAIALEDLKGIRQRVTVRRDQRASWHTRSGSFFQLRAFLGYKAQLAGITAIPVDPRNTSRTCPQCGCVDKRNRPSQSKFSCVSCGRFASGFADHIAARNTLAPHASAGVASRAVVNPPNVAHDTCTARKCRCEAKAVAMYSVPTELRSSGVTCHSVLLGVSLTYPITIGGDTFNLIVYQLLYTGMFLAGILVASDSRPHLIAALSTATIWLVCTVIYAIDPADKLKTLATYLALLPFQATIAYFLLRYIFRKHAVNRDVLLAAITVFILLGALFVPIYGTIELLQPGSFVDNARTGQLVFLATVYLF